jgi:4-diphosphocytidyl-2-C-methyl-D-erythritol kinase
MDDLVVKSKAKINLGLNIVSKRSDGFHNLETIFYPLKLSDELSISKSDKFSFQTNNKILIEDNNNLIIRAKDALENLLGTELHVNIYLKKNIPIGAGLGGGSSNAAATLLALTKLFNLKIQQNDLLDIALELGSDVPYFLNPVSAFAESRGEIITPINLKINEYLLTVNPGIHISTKWAFGRITPKKTKISLKFFVEKDKIEIEDLISIATNDFEKIVFEHFLKVKEIKDKMMELGAIISMMTGTGSTVWGIFKEKEIAEKTEQYFKIKNYFTYSESPT